MEDLLTLGKDGGEAKRELVSGFAFLFFVLSLPTHSFSCSVDFSCSA